MCHVIVFLMNVTGTMDAYPEVGMRRCRVWLPGNQAVGRIEDAGLREIVRSVAASS
ncbi:MAG: hypothetical protein U0736_07770 [Gemmataceae bacterium]